MAELILNPLSRRMVSPHRRLVRLGGETDLTALSGIERRFLDCPYHKPCRSSHFPDTFSHNPTATIVQYLTSMDLQPKLLSLVQSCC